MGGKRYGVHLNSCCIKETKEALGPEWDKGLWEVQELPLLLGRAREEGTAPPKKSQVRMLCFREPK